MSLSSRTLLTTAALAAAVIAPSAANAAEGFTAVTSTGDVVQLHSDTAPGLTGIHKVTGLAAGEQHRRPRPRAVGRAARPDLGRQHRLGRPRHRQGDAEVPGARHDRRRGERRGHLRRRTRRRQRADHHRRARRRRQPRDRRRHRRPGPHLRRRRPARRRAGRAVARLRRRRAPDRRRRRPGRLRRADRRRRRDAADAGAACPSRPSSPCARPWPPTARSGPRPTSATSPTGRAAVAPRALRPGHGQDHGPRARPRSSASTRSPPTDPSPTTRRRPRRPCPARSSSARSTSAATRTGPA